MVGASHTLSSPLSSRSAAEPIVVEATTAETCKAMREICQNHRAPKQGRQICIRGWRGGNSQGGRGDGARRRHLDPNGCGPMHHCNWHMQVRKGQCSCGSKRWQHCRRFELGCRSGSGGVLSLMSVIDPTPLEAEQSPRSRSV
jgi:hypothetical protein